MRRYSPPQLLLFAGLIIAAGLIVWQLAQFLLLVFGAILIGVLLSSVAAFVGRWTGLKGQLPLILSVLALTGVGTGFIYLMGSQLLSELSGLMERIPELLAAIEQRVDVGEFRKWMESEDQSMLGEGSIVGRISGLSANLLSVAVNLLVVVAGGIYFAAHPEVYRRGILALVPAPRRDWADKTLTDIFDGLGNWLVGQIIAMVCVGVFTTIGLYLLGIPSPMALGFLAGLLEFVPYVGPIVSTIPAVAIGLSQGVWPAFWVLLLYFGVQQLEALLLIPLIQKRAVQLPPGLTIFSILAFGFLLGPGGVVLGMPLTVVFFVLGQNLIELRDSADAGT